jgi:xanthine dehydrogenase accessory factor
MIGSRRQVRAAFHALLESGVTPEQIAHVHAPVGLDLGAETPAEMPSTLRQS